MNEETKIIENTEAEATGATETKQIQEEQVNQAEKLFKQEDVDRIIANRLKQAERKYEGVDVEEYKSLKAQAEQAKEKQMIKKEQFEQLLQKQKAEADAKMAEMQKQIIKKEADDLESMSDWKSRVLGVGKRDVI